MSMHDDHNTIEPMDELELYVLDLLDDDERETLEAQIAADPAMQERLRELRGTAGMLAFDLEPMTPPPGLRDAILQQARADTSGEPARLHPVEYHEPVSIERRAPWMWVAAAILAIAMVGAIVYAAGGDQPGDLRTYPVAVTEASDAPVSGEIILREGSEQATLVLSGLQEPPAGQVYQVWLVAGENPPEPNITFRPGSDGQANLLIRGNLPASQLLAITLEPSGGSPAPTTDILLTSDLTQPESV